jgi:hypothetical protein
MRRQNGISVRSRKDILAHKIIWDTCTRQAGLGEMRGIRSPATMRRSTGTKSSAFGIGRGAQSRWPTSNGTNPQDLGEVVKWFVKAAAQWFCSGLHQLGRVYQHGWGAPGLQPRRQVVSRP